MQLKTISTEFHRLSQFAITMFRPIRLTPQARFGVPYKTPANAGAVLTRRRRPASACPALAAMDVPPQRGPTANRDPTAKIQPRGTKPYGSPGSIADEFGVCQYISKPFTAAQRAPFLHGEDARLAAEADAEGGLGNDLPEGLRDGIFDPSALLRVALRLSKGDSAALRSLRLASLAQGKQGRRRAGGKSTGGQAASGTRRITRRLNRRAGKEVPGPATGG
jgi:hypothetical protein